jgi:hypothetical protein
VTVVSVRYPLEPLAAATGREVHDLLVRLGVTGSTMQDYKSRGISAVVADRMAVRCGLHPHSVWPEMRDDAIADLLVTCEAADCDQTFIRSILGRPRRFCGGACNRRHLLHSDPAKAELNRVLRRRYYAENGDYERARQRRADQAAADRKRKRAA